MRIKLISLFLFSSGLVFSQTGPGGVGNSTTNVIWLRADSGVYSDAGTTLASNTNSVQEWHDNSGNGNNAIENTASDRPQYQTNQANGFPAIDFDGSNDRLLATGVATGDEATVIAVIRSDGLVNNNDGIIQASPSGLGFSTGGNDKSIGMWIERAAARPWGRGVQSNNTARSIPTNVAISIGTMHIITNDYDGSDITQYVDGATSGTISYDGTLRSWTDFGIGRQGSETFNGDIAEVIAYNVTLNDAQLIIVQNYLKAKYGITLTTNNIYTMDTPANGNYDYEVAGIGRAGSGAINHTDSRGSAMVQISKSGGGLGNNEYLFWGHENGDLSSFGHNDVPVGVEARLGRMWKVSEQGEVGDVNIDFDLTNLGAVTVTDLRLLVDTDGDGDFSDATVYSGASSLSGNVYRFTTNGNDVIESGYGFTIATINVSQTPLPVTLTEFKCQLKDNVVAISWTTESEVNNEKFEVERSNNLTDWYKIHTAPGAGNSRVRLTYACSDDEPLDGIGYYRLRQTDFDGRSTTSGVEVVIRDAAGGDIHLYPNPATNYTVNVEFPLSAKRLVSVSLIDMDGRLILTQSLQKELPASGPVVLNLPEVKGFFFLQLQTDEQMWVKKIRLGE